MSFQLKKKKKKRTGNIMRIVPVGGLGLENQYRPILLSPRISVNGPTQPIREKRTSNVVGMSAAQ